MNQNSLTTKWQQSFSSMPLVAILRGITPDECLAVADVIFSHGFEILEVPLNSPDPYTSIAKLIDRYPNKFIGAGTVTSVESLETCVSVGCELIVTPNFNPSIASAIKQHELIYYPGVATPSEAFMAIEAGAHGLKLFPAELISPKIVKAMRAVLPQSIKLIPVGGITPTNMDEYLVAGASGFGLGSALYQSGKSVADIGIAAQSFVKAINLTNQV